MNLLHVCYLRLKATFPVSQGGLLIADFTVRARRGRQYSLLFLREIFVLNLTMSASLKSLGIFVNLGSKVNFKIKYHFFQ